MSSLNMQVRYLDPSLPAIESGHYGDWIDVRASSIQKNGENQRWQRPDHLACKSVTFEAMDIVKIGLGFAAQLPKGCEAHLLPRSSLFKRHGLIMTNSMGVVDSDYCGNNDEWFVEFLAIFPNELRLYERVVQFKIVPKMSGINVLPVKQL